MLFAGAEICGLSLSSLYGTKCTIRSGVKDVCNIRVIAGVAVGVKGCRDGWGEKWREREKGIEKTKKIILDWPIRCFVELQKYDCFLSHGYYPKKLFPPHDYIKE